MTMREAFIAVRRFGLGARAEEIRAVARDPRGHLLAALDGPPPALPAAAALVASDVTLTADMLARQRVRLARMADPSQQQPGGPPRARPEARMAPGMPMDGGPASAPKPPAAQDRTLGPGPLRRDAFRAEAAARITLAVETTRPYLERLVMHWSNHFCVSATKGPLRGIVGAYEREVIRPHVLGRFEDMLRAAVRHPAMLIYLDNHVSIGPNSRAGQRRRRGLNENLAREILELHTLGVDGGYTQSDVTALARILTGWTVAGLQRGGADAGRFRFQPNWHEPGAVTLLGRRFADHGEEAGLAALRFLAHHPATARNVCRKLARHFLGSGASAAVIGRLEQVFKASDGDLGALARTLVGQSGAWGGPPVVLLPPYDFLVAGIRGLALPMKPMEVLRLTNMLGQPLWSPPSPKGWPDAENAWAAPAALRERLRITERMARLANPRSDPRSAASDILAGGLTDRTREAVARAETRVQALELLLMSPEFQRR
ncbi:MAG: DUF1800 family protein [Hyphomicrobiaceae bacterium]|nr:DUF1800 family protein [Hyphomicrobiaceae bacterium]